MNKNTLLKIIKYNYINQFKSLNYNLKNSYPVTWNKDLFTESIKDINFKNIELIKDQYINAITSSLNLDDIHNTTYDDAINNVVRSTNININELEYILKEYIDENKDNLDNLQPVNALNNTNLMSKLDMLHNGYYILNGSNNSNQSLLLKRAAYIVAYARGDIDREAAVARVADEARLAKEAAKAKQAARLAAEEAARVEAERVAAEEVARVAAERVAVEKAATRAKVARLALEEAARAAAKLAAEEAARAEAARLAAAAAAQAEAERIKAAEAAKVKAVRLAAEAAAEAARVEAEQAAKLAAEEAARVEAAQLAAEKAARVEAARLAAEEAARLAADEAARAEAARLAAEKVARLAAEESARLSAEKVVKLALQKIAKAEAAKLAAEKAVKLAAEKAAKLAVEEAARLAAEEAARIEAARLAAEEAARVETARLAAEEAARLAVEEAERVEAARLTAEEAKARLAAEEAARVETARLAAEEAARVEAARLAAEEAAKLEAAEAARVEAAEEAARVEAARLAAKEVARVEAERLAAKEAAARIKAAEEAARAEAARLEAEEAARVEAERLAMEEAKARLAAEEAKAAQLAAEKAKASRLAAEKAARVQAAKLSAERAAAAEAARKLAADKRRIAEAAAKAAAFHKQMRDASVRLKKIDEICNEQYQLNLANIKSLQPSYLNLIRNIKLSIKQEVNSEYVKINSIDISPINIESTLKDILRVLIQDPSDDLIDNIYIDITDNTKQKIENYKITANSFIKQDEFQRLLLEIKKIYIKNTNLLNKFEKFKGIILSLVDIFSSLSNLKQDIVALNKQIDDEAKIKEEYELYLKDIKSTYDELTRYLRNRLLNDNLKKILPSLNEAMSLGAFSTYSKILELIAQFKVVPSDMGLRPIYREVNKILIHMESIYKMKYENIKDALIVFPHNLAELKQSKLDMITQISNTIDSHNVECDKIFNKFLVMTGGNSANKELLYNAVAAFLIQNSNQKNFKSLLISLISNNIKIKNNKINIVLPKMNEILKIISLPLYCTDKGINVKYSTMQKCVKNNIHKYVDNDNTNKYLKELNLNSNDKLLAKEFDYRITNIQKIINKK